LESAPAIARGEKWGIALLGSVSVLLVIFSALNLPGADFASHLWVSVALFVAFVLASRKSDGLMAESWHRILWQGVGAFAAITSIGHAVIVAVDVIPDFPKVRIGELVQTIACIPMMFAVGVTVINSPSGRRVRVMLDWLVSAVSLVPLGWALIVSPSIAYRSPSAIDRSLNTFVPTSLGILCLSAILIVLAAWPYWRARRVFAGIAAGGFLIALGAILANVAFVPSVVEAGCSHFGAFLLALAASRFDSQLVANEAARVEAEPSQAPTALSLLTPYAVGCFAFATLAGRDIIVDGGVSNLTFATGAVLLALVIARQVVGMRENLALWSQIARFNQNLEEVVRRRTVQLEAMHGLSKAIGHSLDVEQLVQSTNLHGLKALRADALVINLAPFAFMGHPRIGELVSHRGIDGNFWVLDQLNVLETPRVLQVQTLYDPLLARSAKCLLMPVESKGRALGWVAAFRWSEEFEEADASIIQSIGSELGTALENARLYEVARQMADIDPVSGLLNHRASQERIATYFDLAEANKAPLSLLMLDINNFKQFNDTYGHLAGDDVLKSVGRIVRNAVRGKDVPGRYGSDEFMVLLPEADESVAEEIASQIYERVAEAGYPEPGTDRVIPYQVSIGIACYPDMARTRHELLYVADNAMLDAKRNSSNGSGKRNVRKPARAEGDTFDLLDSMINAVDNKDYYTRAHSEDVTDVALAIAMELGYSGEALRIIRMTGLLHDVGKIGIPDEILRKPGQLTDDEYEVMKQHPVVGAMIVASMPGMAEVIPGVKHHHERFDGGGYPDALAGEAIPFLGRLLAVPDAYSAMTTDRPYRRGMSHEIAMERILAGSGTHFDPVIVQAFERVMALRGALESARRAA
jgi:diguanylate cyclase (GGDEF)-like protein/putative nucleotidyltransferase with HDIG domain